MRPNDKPVDLVLLLQVILIFCGSVLLGGLIAPPVYNGLVALGRLQGMPEALRELEFEKLAARCVLISVLAGAFVMMRCARLTNLELQGFARGTAWERQLGTGFGLGMLSMALLLFAAGWTGAYLPDPTLSWDGRFALKMLGNLAGAFLIGTIEEWLFRGVIFGTLRKAMGVLAAAVLGSVLFSLVHFARPENPFGVVHASWDAAYRLMPYMFTLDDIRWDYEGFKMATLFFMGLSLCFFYARRRTLYFIIGLHAGWVWIMRFGDAFFDDRTRDLFPLLFGPTPGVAKSGAALGLSVVFAGVAAWLYFTRREKQNGGLLAESSSAA